MQIHIPLVLASRSPRRQRLLNQLGLDFQVHPSGIDEVIPPARHPSEAVEILARRKAAAVADNYPDALTVAADTIVVLGDRVLEKPADEIEAIEMLRCLSNNTHTVYTGVALVYPAAEVSVLAHEATEVTFDVLDDEEIEAYVATGSPMDKAGGYGLQDDLGAVFIRRIEGDYYNVVGLPLNRFYRLLTEHFRDAITL